MIVRRSFMAALLAALAGCGSSSADGDDQRAEPVRLAATAAAAPEAIESVPQVDTTGLDASGQRAFRRLVNELLSPCGEPVSVAQCAVEGRGCRACVPAARYVARLVSEGFEDSEIREFFRARFDPAAQVTIDLGDSPVRGAPMAPVTVVEFSDFECPHCRYAHPQLERLVREHEGDVRVVFKHYPLDGHTYARQAARAAVAAHRQGKFWPMHDLLFENQERLAPADIERYARQAGLDLERFRADLAAASSEEDVMRDKSLGTELGIQGTPTVFVNGRPYLGPLETLGTYVREELDR